MKEIYMLRLYFLTLCLFGATISHAQVFEYNFNDCGLTSSANPGTATALGSIDCVCGIVENGIELDGSNDAVIFPSEILGFMEDDFTIDFYFSVFDATSPTDIFSIRNNCSADSLISIRYLPQTEEVLLEMGRNNGLFISDRGPIGNNCWTRVTLSKINLNYNFYIDNIRVATLQPGENIPFSDNAQIAFSNSPCLIFSDERLEGRIDEFKIYDRGLTDVEILNSTLVADQISSNDTTIVVGESVQIDFGNTCATSIQWTPSDGVSELDVLEPVIIPTETTTYSISLQDGDCLAEDEVTIFVIDPSDKECDNLLLPNAFTPNDDNINDLFGISNTFIVDVIDYFEIADRWGNVVFKGQNKDSKWDGRYGSNLVEPGNFIYKIGYQCGGNSFDKTGLVTVIR